MTEMVTSTASPAPHELPYAMPAPSYGHKVMAGAAIVFAGLGLVVLGGCFLIGVMIVTNRGFDARVFGTPLTWPAILLLVVLYALAAASFLFAAIIVIRGLQALFRVVRS